MNTRRFRPLDTDVSALGFGTWALGGESKLGGKALGWGATDVADAERAVRRALDAGVTFFDTADVYGNGVSESLLGEWIGDRTDVTVCTKFGNREDASGRGLQDFGTAWLGTSVEGSLRRLRRERLDVLLLHSPPDDFDWATFDTTPFEKLRTQGKLGAYGVSCRSIVGAKRVVEAGFGSTLEVIYNALDRRVEAVLPSAHQAGYAIVARVPFASGFLAGRFDDRPEAFGPNDFRSGLAPEDVRYRAESSRALSFLGDLPGGMAVSALRFCLSRSEITTVIPGMRRLAQVEQNLGAADAAPLDADTIAAIARAVPRVYKGWEV